MDSQLKHSKRRFDATFICMLLLIVVGFIFMHDLMGENLLEAPAWDSYTLQAMAWRNGRVYLDQNYTYLELAVYNGHYFVSFPPFPSVLMFPLTFIFGGNVPTTFIMMLYSLALAAVAYLIFKKFNVKSGTAAFLTTFYVFGSNIASIALNGGVWWHAQILSVLLCTLALYCALCDKRVLAYMFVAFSVGCRPFTILFFILLAAMFYNKDKREHPEQGFIKLIARQLPCLIIPVLVGCAYMFYNYIRFDNPLEFGHNYLPEFTESEHGQFSLVYLWGNLSNLLFRPVELTNKLGLTFTKFDGFMFYVANPIFLIVIIRAIADAIKKRFNWMHGLTLSIIILYVLILCCHKTLGGWQFGARYTVDMLPMALLYLIIGGAGKTKKNTIPQNYANILESEAPIDPSAAYEDETDVPTVDTAEAADTINTVAADAVDAIDEVNTIDTAEAIPEAPDDAQPETTEVMEPLYKAYEPTLVEKVIMIFGIMFNIYGAVYFWIVNYK